MNKLDNNLENVSCPICCGYFPKFSIDTHVNQCLDSTSSGPVRTKEEMSENLKENKTLSTTAVKQSQNAHTSISCDNTKLLNQMSHSQSESSTIKQTVTLDTESCLTKKRTAWSFMKSPVAVSSDSTRNKRFKQNQNVSDKSSAECLNNENIQQSENPLNAKFLTNSPIPSQSLTSKTVDSRPLAERMRPSSLDEYVGQEKVLGRNSVVRKLLEYGRITSMIIWGPPGCGKTTLARLIANVCRSDSSTAWRFVPLSAATSGIADVKDCIKVAKNEATMFKRKTVLFVDEIHRFNKLQQDAFLPHVEDGTVVLVGATTENPSFHVNNALLSRCTVVVLEKLSVDDVCVILRKTLRKLGVVETEKDSTLSSKGDTNEDVSPTRLEDDAWFEEDTIPPCTQSGDPVRCDAKLSVTPAAVQGIAALCDGDARSALNTLQIVLDAKTSALMQKSGESLNSSVLTFQITEDDVKEVQGRGHCLYDRAGDEHYNCASALQKSVRGSDDSAALYWLARMLEGGEDPLFIARRLVVCASEDIGLADNRALSLAVSTFQACQFIGMPECAINLAHCVTYLARAPKSNESYAALDRARSLIANTPGPQPGVPLHLRNASTKLMAGLGYGSGYQYNHTVKNVTQYYLPLELVGTNLFVDKK